ncbi:MAG: hypothetical protein L0H37_05635, partial [Nitrosospira sp.]|nr:hypothetical protein [Nitrosospira sp.]
GRMNNYAALSQNSPTKQNPARSSREFMKHPGYECLTITSYFLTTLYGIQYERSAAAGFQY